MKYKLNIDDHKPTFRRHKKGERLNVWHWEAIKTDLLLIKKSEIIKKHQVDYNTLKAITHSKNFFHYLELRGKLSRGESILPWYKRIFKA